MEHTKTQAKEQAVRLFNFLRDKVGLLFYDNSSIKDGVFHPETVTLSRVNKMLEETHEQIKKEQSRYSLKKLWIGYNFLEGLQYLMTNTYDYSGEAIQCFDKIQLLYDELCDPSNFEIYMPLGL